ncbi:hypothetical protein QTP70_009728 [Hemibagrus guttatus]|uniref:Integrase catalytic domain-containing protein n=1 Tax=Hemibagrus guttatus TaxID=175788 RepID=A0AAE0Q3V4_9TELE|nr:hypothetical protein QTP70_009728 [Hemibagrus guttatus]KAK3534536.1 hypothetical protein QTP86_016617 [Hemibagrus guttatus]
MELCATCAQSRMSCQLLAGLLELLPVPQRPWSHMEIDFITNLPDSGGNNTVLVAIDRFSKACHLVPLKGLPTAMDKEDIVSDCGSQFTSRVWRDFCMHLGINISLSSSYHPQSNGQTEQLNQEIGRYLQSYCSREQQQWSEPSDVPAMDDWIRRSQEVWESTHVRLQRAI